MEKKEAKTFNNIDSSLFTDKKDEKTFCLIMQGILTKKMSRNSMEIKLFLNKMSFIYYQKVLHSCICYDEKVEFQLDQLYWPQFLIIKQKCIFETIDDTVNILVKHPDVKKILKFIDENDEEKSIRKLLQKFNECMIDFLNKILVLEFKMLRKLVLRISYRRKTGFSYFECQGCGNMVPGHGENPLIMDYGNNIALHMLLAGMDPYEFDDESDGHQEDSDEEENEEEEEDSDDEEDEEEEDSDEEENDDQDEEDEIQKDSSKFENLVKKILSKEPKAKSSDSKKKYKRKRVLHFSHGRY